MGATPSPTPESQRIGAVLRARRIHLGLTQEELADTLGFPRSRISAMENGSIGHLRLLLEVSTALGLELVMLAREESGTAEHVERSRQLVEHVHRRVARDAGRS